MLRLALGTLLLAASLPGQVRMAGLTAANAQFAVQGPRCIGFNQCTLVHPPAQTAYAGGAAYEARQDAVWLTNGTRLETLRYPQGSGCPKRCAYQLVPQVPGNLFPSTNASLAILAAALAGTLTLAPAEGEVTATGPKIAADEAVFDFGSVAPSGKVEHVFTIRNVGDADLHIDHVKKT